MNYGEICSYYGKYVINDGLFQIYKASNHGLLAACNRSFAGIFCPYQSRKKMTFPVLFILY